VRTLVKYYETPGGYQRGFCRECGSPILNRTALNSKRAREGFVEMAEDAQSVRVDVAQWKNGTSGSTMPSNTFRNSITSADGNPFV
jgi:hypothetical protein